MRLSVHPAARAEIISATETYRAESVLAGRRFAAKLREALGIVLEYPSAFAADRDDVRHKPINAFPYAVAYRLNDDVVEVIALAHARRNPDYWRGRL